MCPHDQSLGSLAGADPNQKRNGKTPLWVAADNGRLEEVEMLVEVNADKDLVDDATGQSPLWTAANLGNLEIVKCLVKARADCNKVDKSLGVQL